jgi:hypothetical protein
MSFYNAGLAARNEWRVIAKSPRRYILDESFTTCIATGILECMFGTVLLPRLRIFKVFVEYIKAMIFLLSDFV